MKVVLGKLNDELLINLMNRSVPFTSHVQAAVAYAQGNHPFFQVCKERNLRLTFYGLLDEDAGAVAPNLLADLLNQGPLKVECRLLKGHFHSKVIWWHGFGAYIGSANLTHAAWFNNVEAGVFYTEAEMVEQGIGDTLDGLFDHLHANSVPLTRELLAKIEALAADRRSLADARRKVEEKFASVFNGIPANPGLTVVPPKGQRENKRLKNFVREWMETLEKIRGLSKEFAKLGKRPTWVREDAHPTVHFDQFLHAYYYDFVRGQDDDEDEEGASTAQRVENAFEDHRGDPTAALLEGARWWAGLKTAPYGEDEFIHVTAPSMQARLSKDAVANMTLPTFREALRHVNAFRMHARQVKNVEFGLPPDHHESQDERVNRLCDWLWKQRTPNGKTIRDVLEFVLWGSTPSDMEQRLWLGVWSDDYRLSHFGQSSLGEAVGWARPDDFPPRNNRTNKALRALGHDVKLFASG